MSEDYALSAKGLNALLPGFQDRQRTCVDEVYEILAPLVAEGAVTRIIDLGCGLGDILLGLARRFEANAALEFCGLDSSSEQIEMARRQSTTRGDPRVSFVVCDDGSPFFKALERPLRTRQGDVVLCLGHTIFHLPYLDALLDDAQSAGELGDYWVVDVYQSWDRVLIQSRHGEVLEPRSMDLSRDTGRLCALYTRRRADEPDVVERGLKLFDADLVNARVQIRTTQAAWSSATLSAKFTQRAFRLAQRQPGASGYGRMDRLVFAPDQAMRPVSSLFASTPLSRGQAGEGRRSPLEPIARWIDRTGLLAIQTDFRFVMIEVAPWYSDKDGLRALHQEILICGAPPFDQSELAGALSRYTHHIRHLPKDIGPFFHPAFAAFAEDREEGLCHFSLLRGPSIEAASMTPAEVARFAHWRRQAEAGPAESLEAEKLRALVARNVTALLQSKPIDELVSEIRVEYEARLQRDYPQGAASSALRQRDLHLVQALLHERLRASFDVDTAPGEKWTTCLMGAPLHSVRTSKEGALNDLPDYYRGGLWVFAGGHGEHTPKQHDLLQDLMRLCVVEITSSIETAASKALSERARADALRSAKQTAAAAIMTRNLSHNIGSNPLARVIKDLELTGVEDAEARKMLFFLRYLRDRMDLLAEITTGRPNWCALGDLKKLCDAFAAQEALREGLTRLGQKAVRYAFSEALPVFMPHGALGAQALYAIFENIIRNSAQYGDLDSKDGGAIAIDAEAVGECIRLTIADLGRTRPCDPMNAERVLSDLRRRFADPFYNDDADARGPSLEAWGLKEMKICAAFLRLQPAWNADREANACPTPGYLETKDAEWIEVDWTSTEEGDYLCYRLVLLRPKLALIVADEAELVDAREKLAKFGVEFEPSVDALSRRARAAPIAHRYLVIEGSHVESARDLIDNESFKASLPLRRLVLDGDEDTNLLTGPAIVDALSRGSGALEALLGAAWNRHLARKANGVELVLELPTLVGGKASHAVPNVNWRSEGTLASCNDLGLAPRQRAVVHERHSAAQNGLAHRTRITCCWSKVPCIKHATLWREMQTYVGLGQGDDVSTYAAISDGDQALAERVMEAGLVWTLIVDERLSPQYRERYEDWLKLARAGIIISPFKDEKNIALEELHSSAFLNLLQEVSAHIGGAPGLLYVTMHLDLLKRFDLAHQSGLSDIRRDLREGGISEIEIGVHSGRGIPPELIRVPNARFIEFANLQNLVTGPADKTALVDVLMATRRSTVGLGAGHE